MAEINRALANPHLARALEEEKLSGQRIAIYSRTIALVIIAALTFFINPTISGLYYQMFLVGFIVIGLLQLRVARVGQSGAELALIFADFALLTFVCVAPNPLVGHEVPAGFSYRFDIFIYFFVLLAGASLAYSWRTVWSIGTWVPLFWAAGLAWAYWFGNTMPELGERVAQTYEGYPLLLEQLDPNSLEPTIRLQEAVAFAITAAMIALKGWRSNQLLLRQADLAGERANLSRYFSPNMVDLLASSGDDLDSAREQNAGVLFADIAGFTPIAENHPPEQVLEWLREIHGILEDAVFANNGTLDKYLGDGIMATFGTPGTTPNDPSNALKAARQIIGNVDEHNRMRVEKGLPELRVCVGIHYGPVLLGNIGREKRLEFAVIGDTVNVAARLEGATRTLACRIVASDALMEKVVRAGDNHLVEDFTAMPGLVVKGRKAKIDVWTCGDQATRP